MQCEEDCQQRKVIADHFYRPQTKFTKLMFLHLSVSHSVHRGACVAGGGHAWQGGNVWQGACMAGGMHDRGHAWGWRHAWQGGMCDRGACMAGGMHGSGGHVWQGHA